MQLGHPLDEITYSGLSQDGSVDTYTVSLEGRPTMLVVCDHFDSKHRIRIAKPDGSGAQVTNGVWTWYDKLVEDADGSPVGTLRQVDYKSVYTYVVPRLHILIARLLLGPVS